MAIEIVDLPIKNGDFPQLYGTVYQRATVAIANSWVLHAIQEVDQPAGCSKQVTHRARHSEAYIHSIHL